jgi:HEAT repeat protein
VASHEVDVQEQAALTQTFDEFVAQLESGRDRGRRSRTADLVGRLGRPAAGFLQPELERLLRRYVDADDPVARDQVARVLAAASGSAALPTLMRAMAEDRNDDGDTLQLTVLDLFRTSPAEALAQVMTCLAADDAGLRRVGVWGLSVLDWTQNDDYLELVVAAATDAAAQVRSEAVAALGTVFGAGHPRARDAVTTAVRDPDPVVRRSAVGALRSWRDDTATDLLAACAHDADRWVRFHAAWGLSSRTGPAVQAALEHLAADGDADVRAAARKVLTRRTTPSR